MARVSIFRLTVVVSPAAGRSWAGTGPAENKIREKIRIESRFNVSFLDSFLCKFIVRS